MSKIVYQDTPLNKGFRVGKDSIEIKKYKDEKIHVYDDYKYPNIKFRDDKSDVAGFCDTEPVTFHAHKHVVEQKVRLRGYFRDKFRASFDSTPDSLDQPFNNFIRIKRRQIDVGVDSNSDEYVQNIINEMCKDEMINDNTYHVEFDDESGNSAITGIPVFNEAILSNCTLNSRIYEIDYRIIDLKIIERKIVNNIKTEYSLSFPENESECEENEITEENAEMEDYECIIEGTMIASYEYHTCSGCGKRMSNLHAQRLELRVGQYIYNNPDSIKESTIYKEIKICKRDGLAHKRITKNMTIFKKDTQKIYYVNNFWIAGDSLMYHINKKDFKIRDKTFDYNMNFDKLHFGLKYGLFEYLVTTWLKKYHGKELRYTASDLKAINNNFIRTNYVIRECMYIKNRFGIKNTNLAYLIIKLRAIDKTLLSKIKGMTEKEIFAYLKINKKMAAKIVANSEGYSNDFNGLVYGYKFFNTKDYINKLALNHNFNYVNTKTKKYNFLYQYAKHNSEVRMFNQISSVEQYILSDTIRMYERIMKNTNNYTVEWDRPIKELHDIISADENKLGTKNTPIPQNRDMNKVFKDFEFDGIRYRLAKDTYELIDVGAKMNICVGGYGDRAVSKKCIIVVGYKDDEPVTCIEINKNDKYFVAQTKKSRNHYPAVEEADKLIELFEKNDMTYTKHDLRNATKYGKVHELGGVI